MKILEYGKQRSSETEKQSLQRLFTMLYALRAASVTQKHSKTQHIQSSHKTSHHPIASNNQSKTRTNHS